MDRASFFRKAGTAGAGFVAGGALADVNGNLIGINSAIYSRNGGSMGIGFAIPVKLAQQVTEVDGTIPSMQTIKSTMIKDMRQNLPPYIKEDFISAFDEELNVQDLLLKTQQLYAQTFTEAELKKWIDFYSTPEGKSIAGKMPMLSEKVMILGQDWGKEAAERVLLLMQAKKQK